MLNNVDCNSSTTSCISSGSDPDTYTYTPTGFGTDLGWASAATARVGIARAVAFALMSLPQTTTFAAVAAEMYDYLLSNYGATVASSFEDILDHHGLSF